MSITHPSGDRLHIGYCSNVHAGEDVSAIVDQLHRFAGPVRRRLEWPRLAVGLWLPITAVGELRDPARLDELRGALADEQLEVVSLNGFPYEAFHAPVVKHAVYRPSWAEPTRLSYTLELAALLHRLLPADATSGSISTLPFGWRYPWTPEMTATARGALSQLADGLARLADEHGRAVRVALEPEPGCVIETTGQAVEALRDLRPEWIGLCVDACHLAVQFEDPAPSLATVVADGVPVVKAQLSCALRTSGTDAAQTLAPFVEPRFLHQARQQVDGRVAGVDDLDDALRGGLAAAGEWRVHFHVPVHADPDRTTQAELVQTIAALVHAKHPLTTHLEVETYTWSVLPGRARPKDEEDLVEGITKELAWVADAIEDSLEEKT